MDRFYIGLTFIEGTRADLFADEPDFELPEGPTVLEGRDEPDPGHGDVREIAPEGFA